MLRVVAARGGVRVGGVLPRCRWGLPRIGDGRADDVAKGAVREISASHRHDERAGGEVARGEQVEERRKQLQRVQGSGLRGLGSGV